MSWSYLPVLAEVFSEKTFWDILRLEQLRSSRFAEKFCLCDSRTTAAQSSQSGMMLGHSASITRSAPPISSGSAASGIILSSQEDFRVRILALQDAVAASPEQSHPCGSRWRALSPKFNRQMYLSKTRRLSSPEDLSTSYLHWPRWGMMQNGVCWALDISTIRLSGSVYGCWGNVTKQMGKDFRYNKSKESLLKATYGAKKSSLVCRMLRDLDLWPTVTLVETLMGWPELWTALQPLATDKYQQWQLSHGHCSTIN